MKFTLATTLFLITTVPVLAQTAAEIAEFEVASVKVAAPGSGPLGGRMMAMPLMMGKLGFNGGPGTKDPGRFTGTGVTLKALLMRAYNLEPYQVSGPSWLESERYDITAKVPPDTDQDRFRQMLQKLLSDRFRIQVHRENRELTFYKLTVAKGGPKLAPAEAPQAYASDEERQAAMKKQVEASVEKMRSGTFTPGSSFRNPKSTMAKLAETLSRYVDAQVRDMTGLEGEYLVSLHWVPDGAQSMAPKGGDAAPDTPPGTSLFAALQEQLGLKLERAKGPLEMLVIDKADKVPVEN